MDGNRVAVVGGGLAGLAAALYLARAGRRVTLFEAAPVLGGRGGTLDRGGFSLNMGPHALYRGGAAMAVLRELGLEPAGSPPPSRGLVGEPGHWQRLPASGMDLLRTGALSLRGKMEWVGRLTALAKPEQAIAEWRGRSAQAWLDTAFRH